MLCWWRASNQEEQAEARELLEPHEQERRRGRSCADDARMPSLTPGVALSVILLAVLFCALGFVMGYALSSDDCPSVREEYLAPLSRPPGTLP
jgi:hypothetical protein